MDVSRRSLETNKERLRLDELLEHQWGRIELIQSSLTYRDLRLNGFEAVAIVEVIEHLDAPRLATDEARSACAASVGILSCASSLGESSANRRLSASRVRFPCRLRYLETMRSDEIEKPLNRDEGWLEIARGHFLCVLLRSSEPHLIELQ